ncbi:MAG: IS91 family transposase [Methanomicrobiales archaeon]|nr:IS91 family transposase [Methanomicrobiales archaeon]
MDGHRPEVADVFREFQAQYLDQWPASVQQRRVLQNIMLCKTSALGGHRAKCDQCGHEEFFYNSCGDRHCPKCQAAARAKWLADRASEVLGTLYFHVVFTLPEALGPLALQNKVVVYGLLFRAAAETLIRIAKDPKHLGAQVGFLSLLHTWGQTLQHHPHVHCVVPGGGLSPDRTRWIPARDSFFLPVRVLSRVFRGKFLAYLRCAFDEGRIKLHGALSELREDCQWRAFLRQLSSTEWVVYSKPPFGSAERVLKYLARYTHRVAISNKRLVSFQDGKVTFRYKDYRCGSLQRTMTLEATEFMRRFLQHVLPPSFHRIRYYGFLGNRGRRENLALARSLLAPGVSQAPASDPRTTEELTEQSEAQIHTPPKDQLCPVCKKGHMLIVETFDPPVTPVRALQPWDTS